MALPNDPMILLSYVNTQLRDNYSSLSELCKSLCVDKDEITSKLSTIDYEYDENLNKFVWLYNFIVLKEYIRCTPFVYGEK